MAFTRVQGTGKVRGSGVTTLALTFASPPTVGNGIIVLLSQYGGPAAGGGFPGPCTDNRGHTYTVAIAGDRGASPVLGVIWYLGKVTATGAPFTITLTPGVAAWMAASAVEVSGVGGGLAVDQTKNAIYSGVNDIDTGALAALTAADACLAAVMAKQTNLASITVEALTPAWGQEHEELDNSTYVGGEGDTRILTGTALGATPSAKWNVLNAAGTWQACLVAFKTSTPAAVTVPDLTGLTVKQAHDALKALGLSLGAVKPGHHPTIPPGLVAKQDPLPTVSTPAGTAVDLMVSAGPYIPTAPDVLSIGAAVMPTMSPPLVVAGEKLFEASRTAVHPVGTRAQSADGRRFVYGRIVESVYTNIWVQSNAVTTPGCTNPAVIELTVASRIKLTAPAGATTRAANTYAGGVVLQTAQGLALRVAGHEAITASTDFWVQIATSDVASLRVAAGQTWAFYGPRYNDLSLVLNGAQPVAGLWQPYSSSGLVVPAYGWVQVGGPAFAWCDGEILGPDAPLALDRSLPIISLVSKVPPFTETPRVVARALTTQAAGQSGYLPVMLDID